MSLVALRDAISSGPKALPRDALRIGDEAERRSEVLRLGGSIDAALPDGGLPRSAVVEVASPLGLAGATSLAVKACVGAQRGALLHSSGLHSSGLHSSGLHSSGLHSSGLHLHSQAALRSHEAEAVEWCAWIDPWSTLHAPGLVQRGVVLERLLVVRPPEDAIARCAVRIASSKAFALVVVDLVPPLGCAASGGAGVRLDRWPNVVRRLALAVEDAATTVLLLTDASAHRALPLPVAMRVELARDPARGAQLRIAKDRHGRVGHGAASFVPFDLASA